ncbi:hypothetical protein [uncultured Sphingorhabdus sp.]|uniref:hypothetical protein n=1 Tax=uncultured Sphingorhabdus sp. TaxID=1686106 RepID=UPI0026270B66|nr:hypothetical protein [uncultured Sphingorhabdus sp.]HMS19052.1 hypothetical protein [Sphingorhabdus sp.]
MTRPSRLDNPEYAAFAWARYRRLMGWMFAFTLVITGAALGLFWFQYGLISIHLYIATAAGIIFSVMLMSALMGLVFLSSGTGHDEAIEDPFADLADDENEQHRP